MTGHPVRIRPVICITAFLALFGCSQSVFRSTADTNIGRCQNDEIDLSPLVIVVVAHPDDEVLGFGGLIHDALVAGHRVRVVIVTNGQRFCESCAFWKAGKPSGEQCTNDELEAFGEVRRKESLTALRVLGVNGPAVTFLGYYDSSLNVAWRDQRLPPAPAACEVAFSMAPPNRVKTGEELKQDLVKVFESEPSARSIFTTHPLDRHPDHAAIYRFVVSAGAASGRQLNVYASVLHSAGGTDCDYPLPRSATDACANSDARFKPSNLTDRYLPESAWLPPTDADYGRPLIFCLNPSTYMGAPPLKRAAIDAHQTQLGTISRDAGPVDARYVGWTDRAGYLFSFVRRNEVFYLNPAIPERQ
jgi:LmbE family N-acetylglucosaminyl deacetylase